MPIPTPFHPRTSELCVTYRWKDWSGYCAVCTYDISPEREYNAIRQAAGVLDVSPLFKYEVHGPDAGAFLARVMSRDVSTMKVGRVQYLCWCDDHGKVLDDGTCARLSEDHYRVTAAAPSFQWFMRHAGPYRVTIEDSSDRLAALALQGPTARDILSRFTDAELGRMAFFDVCATRFADVPGYLSRTGYTGDLGYELWVERERALELWDTLMHHGRDLGLMAVGLDTLDICRVEAGFIMQGVDYQSAHHALIESQKSTPFELGLGWTVKLGDRSFIGAAALAEEREHGSAWAMVGLDISWEALEALYERYGLPPSMPTAAWRTPVPVYFKGHQVGRATSGAWSPILKKNLALATVNARYGDVGTVLEIEVTVEWERRTVPARVVATPFFDPPRKKARAGAQGAQTKA